MGRAEPPAPPPAREWLAEWTAAGLRLPAMREPLAPVNVRRAAQAVERILGDLEPKTPPTYELEETVRRLAAAWKASATLRDVEPRHMRRASWAFFFPKDRPKVWLGRNDALVRAWLRWLAERGRASTVAAMLRAFLDVYPVDSPSFEDIREALRKQLKAADSPRATRWRERCERFGLLERDGPARLVRRWWEIDVPFDAFLAEAGLAPGLEASAFVEHATRLLLENTGTTLSTGRCPPAKCERAFAWLERDGRLRFDGLRAAVATAFLEPFVEKTPRPEIKEPIQAFLCRVIGDPRIQRQRWSGVRDEIRHVLFRWLVGASLEDFFRLLDQTALDRHWRYRKAFWTAYLEREAIEDAWVVLGPEAARIARRGFDAGAAKLLKGYNVEANHSVLLMRIGGLTVAEWSHNGSCRIWRRGNKSAPKLYEAEYTRSELTNGCDFRQTHHGAERGTWQDFIAAFIEEETRLRVSSTAYMPKNRRQR